MKTEKVNTILLVICVILLAYIAFYIPSAKEAKLQRCFDVAVNLEKARYYPVDNLSITNQDTSSFQKNVIACMVN